MAFTDPERTPDPTALLAGLPRGAAIVYRAFGRSDALEIGRALAQAARRRGVQLVVGGDPVLAAALRANGFHAPERLANRVGELRRLRARYRLTIAAHSWSALRHARRARASAAVLSPVFHSRSPSAGAPLGTLRFASLVRRAGLPVIALGGVDGVSAKRLRRSGAAGLAAIGAFRT